MTNKEELRQLCVKLNLHYLSRIRKFENKQIDNQVDYLFYILNYEYQERRNKIININRKKSNFPVVDLKKKFDGVSGWNFEEAKKLNWLNKWENILIYGKCGKGKTSFSVQVGEEVLTNGYKVFYFKAEELIEIVKTENKKILNDLEDSQLIILDELFYMALSDEDLTILYKKIMALKECRSFIFISNRKPEDWMKMGNDSNLISLFIERVLANSRIVTF